MLRALAGGTLFGERWGESPAAVLALHGWARTHADYAPALGPGRGGPAAPDLPVLAVDLPGFGATPAPEEPWGSADYARALVPLFGPGAELRTPAVVVGHSFGGRVAVHLAAARPDLVAALVLTGVPLLPRPGRRRRPPAGYRVVRTLHRAHLVGERRMERARQRYGSPDYRNAQGVMRAVLVRVVGERYEEQLRVLRCPVELVWADDDTEAPWMVGEEVAAMVPGATLTTCPGAGHLTPLTAPEELRRAVERATARTAAS
ncbi:MAG TPA: alpha/beta hydrolase [Acidimicrobiales bacterium]|nr:alpha/beta hydrolase [Acidimicrobiales bacterium]